MTLKELDSIDLLMSSEDDVHWKLALQICTSLTDRLEAENITYESLKKHHKSDYSTSKWYAIGDFVESYYWLFGNPRDWLEDFPQPLEKTSGIMIADVTKCGAIYLNL